MDDQFDQEDNRIPVRNNNSLFVGQDIASPTRPSPVAAPNPEPENDDAKPDPNLVVPPLKKTHGKLKKFLIFVIIFLLVAGAGGGAWYYQQLEVNDKQKQINGLEEKVSNLLAENHEFRSAQAGTEKTEFKASVGKFNLTLPQGYVLVSQVDGNAGGAPATIVLIASKSLSSNAGIFSDSINLSAEPMEGNRFNALVSTKLEGLDTTKQDSIKIDGVDAEVYVAKGTAPKQVFFTKNDIFYSISMNDNDGSAKTLQAVVQGFKFQ